MKWLKFLFIIVVGLFVLFALGIVFELVRNPVLITVIRTGWVSSYTTEEILTFYNGTMAITSVIGGWYAGKLLRAKIKP